MIAILCHIYDWWFGATTDNTKARRRHKSFICREWVKRNVRPRIERYLPPLGLSSIRVGGKVGSLRFLIPVWTAKRVCVYQRALLQIDQETRYRSKAKEHSLDLCKYLGQLNLNYNLIVKHWIDSSAFFRAFVIIQFVSPPFIRQIIYLNVGDRSPRLLISSGLNRSPRSRISLSIPSRCWLTLWYATTAIGTVQRPIAMNVMEVPSAIRGKN